MANQKTTKKRKNPPHVWVDPRDGGIFAVFTYKDSFGKRKYKYRKARNLGNAKDIYKALESEFKTKGEESFDGDRMTFTQLATYAEKHYVKEPIFVGGLKTSGMKSWRDARQKLKVMCLYFGTRRIKTIRAEDIAEY